MVDKGDMIAKQAFCESSRLETNRKISALKTVAKKSKELVECRRHRD